MAVHSIDGLKVRHFCPARATPSGPKIRKQKFPRCVPAKIFQFIRGDKLELNGLAFDFSEFFFPPFFFVDPLGGAADRRCLCKLYGVSGKNRINGITRVPAGDERFAGIVVDAALIAKLALAVENKKVRCCSRAVGTRDFLRFAVVEIRKIELAVGGASFHLVERVANVGVAHLVEPDRHGIVRLDGNDGDAPLAIVSNDLFEPGFVQLCGRTMVASENDDQYFACFVVLQAMRLAVDTGETEVRRESTKGQRRRPGFVAQGGTLEEKKAKQ